MNEPILREPMFNPPRDRGPRRNPSRNQSSDFWLAAPRVHVRHVLAVWNWVD